MRKKKLKLRNFGAGRKLRKFGAGRILRNFGAGRILRNFGAGRKAYAYRPLPIGLCL